MDRGYPMTQRERIDEFLSGKRLAVVGVSRQARHFSRVVLAELRKRGYDAVPVNTNAAEIAGERSFAKVGDIDPPVEAALVMTPPAAAGEAARQCVEAGIRRIWLYRAEPATVEFCESEGVSVIAGECPLMYLENAAWPHRAHAFFRKLFGTYPR